MRAKEATARPWGAIVAAMAAAGLVALAPELVTAQPKGKSPPERPEAAAKPATAQPVPPGWQRPRGRVSFSMDSVGLPDLVKAISKLTGRRFLFGGKLRAIKTTIVAPTKVTVPEAYQAFLAVLQVNGMTVVPHGRYLKIVSTKGIVNQTTPVLGTAAPVPPTDAMVTRLYRLRHVAVTDVLPVLNELKGKSADLTVWERTNLLILTDTGANIRRLLRIIEELDAPGEGSAIWIQPVHHVAASELAEQLNTVLEKGRARILADDRNGSLVMVASRSDYDRLLAIIKRVDVPVDTAQRSVRVMPLQHAQCADLQQTLSGVLAGQGPGAGAPARGRRRASSRRSSARGAAGANQPTVFDREVAVHCDEATNSLLATATLPDYARLRGVVAELDQPRRQVFIEAAVMDVSIDHSTDLGVAYHGGATADLGGGGDTVFMGGNNPGQSLTGLPASLEALAFGVRGPDLEGTSNLLGTGLSLPAFGIVLHALATSGDTNLLATPHILATDNVLAEIAIGQNVPLQTNVGGGLASLAGLAGQGERGGNLGGLAGLAGLGGLGMGLQAPRQDVGVKLSITPHVNDSDRVRMEVALEFSTAGAPQGQLGAVPINKRTADTTIIARDQQPVVIGGLTRETEVTGATKVPVLGDIPVLGALFRSTSDQERKVSLLLILTPHVVESQADLRGIFERKMQQRQQFINRYLAFDDTLPWQPQQDYSRAVGLLEHIRQTQLDLEEEARLQQALEPAEPAVHEPVEPLALPSKVKPPRKQKKVKKKKRRRKKRARKKRSRRRRSRRR